MPIGFISQDESHGADDLGMINERWHSLRLIEALEFNKIVEASCEALFKKVRKYAEHLECLDPLRHDAELAVGNVVLALSHDDCAQERLDTLTSETRRLMLAVAETRCECSKGAKLPPRSRRLAITGQDVFLVLLWGFCLLFFVLIA